MEADKMRIYNDVEFFTSLRPYRNYRNLVSLKKCVEYISREFEIAGAKPEIQTWKAGGKDYHNVIASYNKDKSARLIVGAHYDVYNDQPGADDNASAVAGLLELVRLVFQNAPPIGFRIDFVAYCLEEPPFFGTSSMGSFVHAKSLFDKGADIMGMICLEMIGYFSDEPESQPFPSPELAKIYPHTANFIIVVGIEKFAAFNKKVYTLMAKNSSIDVQIINFPTPAGLAGLSDHQSYWQFDYPALMINDTSFIRNPNYHTMEDTIETLDFDKICGVINSTYRVVKNM